MTEFVAELRHYCRNPRCRSKLPQPVANPREAFCARGCHSSFYLKRCLVCEGPMAIFSNLANERPNERPRKERLLRSSKERQIPDRPKGNCGVRFRFVPAKPAR